MIATEPMISRESLPNTSVLSNALFGIYRVKQHQESVLVLHEDYSEEDGKWVDFDVPPSSCFGIFDDWAYSTGNLYDLSKYICESTPQKSGIVGMSPCEGFGVVCEQSRMWLHLSQGTVDGIRLER